MFRLLFAAVVCASLVHAAEMEDRVRKSAPVGSATRLKLDAEFGGIRVQPGSNQNVDVEVDFRGDPPSRTDFERMLRDFKLDVVQEGSDIRVSGTFHDGWKPESAFRIIAFGDRHPICRNGLCLEYSTWLREVEYRVTVPRAFSANLDTSGGPISVSDLKGEVDAHTSGGPLNFDHIDGPVNGRTSGGPITIQGGSGSAVVHTSGGPIRIAEVAGDVDASTSGGPISIERATGRVRARTSGGSIEIREAMGAIDASTSGGAVSASLLGQPKEDCRLRSSGGSISVSLGKGVHLDLDASTSGGGRVWTDFPVPNRSERHQEELRAPLNGGGPLLYLRTSGGGISVTHAS
ncbi:MAG TPA: hypothetical protein VME17_01080 [Bryobacteraceae bacterium]|nr:hypothetical protein [Bryobacteraceae bacterium]